MEPSATAQLFPLRPFLIALTAEGVRVTVRDYERIALVLRAGGPWSLLRLRDALRALLAHDEEQRERFDDCFTTFFDLDLVTDPALAEVDLAQALALLDGLARPELSMPPPVEPPLPPVTPPGPMPQRRRWWIPLALLLAVVGLAGALALTLHSPPPPQPGTPIPLPPAATSEPAPPPGQQFRTYRNVPVLADVTPFERRRSGAWILPLVLGLALLGAAGVYGLVLYPRRNPPDPGPAFFDPDPRRPRHFSLGMIGGAPAPLLGEAALDELSDALGYFASDEAGQTLNVSASVEGTLRRGGVPALAFYRRRQLRSVLLLEDSRAEARRWNTLPAELAAGLAQRGVPVIHGSFAGPPDRYTTPDGVAHLLEDLEDQRNAYVLLIFSDGEQLRRHHSPFALEALAYWPQVAWFDLREPRFWGASVALLARYGLPLYPATPAGLLHALRRFLSEQSAAPTTPGAAAADLAEPVGAGMDAYVEQLLGDALPWAQDCALLQPISPGLADRLRRAFHAKLPPQRVERLYRLPDTRVDRAGLLFHPDVLACLRRSCLERRGEAEREQVLDYILEQIAAAEPGDESSLAHLSWEAVRERVRLERDPDSDLARLAQIAHADSPLRGAIRASLDGFGFPGQDDRVPLMLRPRRPQALLRLSRIADGFPAPTSRALLTAIGGLAAAGLALVVFSAALWARAEREGPNLAVAFSGQSLSYVGIAQDGALSAGVGLAYGNPPGVGGASPLRPLAPADEHMPPLRPIPVADLPVAPAGGADYAVAGILPSVAGRSLLFGQGVWSVGEAMPAISATQGLQIMVTLEQKREMPCVERLGEALTVQRCPSVPASGFEQKAWRTLAGDAVADDRMLSIGLEIAAADSPALRAWRDRLLRSGSVDRIYRIALPTYDGDDTALVSVIQQMKEDLSPLAARAQIAWWSAGAHMNDHQIDGALSGFDHPLRLSDGDDMGWLPRLTKLFDPRSPGPLHEAAILAALGRLLGPADRRDLVWMVPADLPPLPPAAPTAPPATATPAPTAPPATTGAVGTAPPAPTAPAATATPGPSPTPQPDWVPALVKVPAGPFLMGSSAADPQAQADEKPQATVTLPDYWIGQTEVTNAQFRPFVEGDGYTNKAYWTAAGWAWRQDQKRSQPYSWGDKRYNAPDQPVVGVTWYEAVAYCRWLSAQTGREFRLPTEAEWEKAARGTDGRIYPWGNTWAAGRANTSEAGIKGTQPVGQYPAGASLYGALDMAGNVYEWCATEWGKHYPYTIEDEWTAAYLEGTGDSIRAIRGGSWVQEQAYARGAYRNYYYARTVNDGGIVGLRVASASPSS